MQTGEYIKALGKQIAEAEKHLERLRLKMEVANSRDGGNRRFILVQLPEATDRAGFSTISAMTKTRLHNAAKRIRQESPMFAGDLGFRVFKLASSNIRAWEPDRNNLAATLEECAEHLKTDRTEADILFELLLKLGLDLTVPIETKEIGVRR